jgi:hypothetical protein
MAATGGLTDLTRRTQWLSTFAEPPMIGVESTGS